MTTWSNSRDSVLRTDLLIKHRVSVKDLVTVLAHYEAHYGVTDLDAATPDEIRQVVREHLHNYGQQALMPEDANPLAPAHWAAIHRAFVSKWPAASE